MVTDATRRALIVGLLATLVAVTAPRTRDPGATAESRPGAERVIDLASAANAAAIHGAPEKDQLGNDMALGDVNGDGIGDLLLGAQFGSVAGRNNAGRAYVIHGSPSWPGARDLAATGAAEWSFLGVGLEPRLGSAVGLGDVAGDSRHDILLGSLLADPPDPDNPARPLANAGTVAVVLGRATAGGQHDFARRPADGLLVGDHRSGAEQLGTALAVADLNGDGRADLAAAAAMRRSQTGGVYVRYGPIGGGVQYLASKPADWTVLGPGTRATLGAALAVGELSGDGVPDLVVSSAYGAPGEIIDTGAVHVFYGQAGPGRRGTSDLANEFADLTVDGEPGDLIGVALNLGVRSCRGRTLAIGDLTGDQLPDLVIGAPNSQGRRGKVLLLAGPLTAGRSDVSAAAWQLLGSEVDARLGWSVAIGDLDADGQADLVVAAPWASYGGRTSAGVVYGFRGPLVGPPDTDTAPVPDLILVGPEPYAGNAGISVLLGDSTGDGLDDLHVAFPDAAPLGRRSVGAAYRLPGPLFAAPPTATASPTPRPSASASPTASPSATPTRQLTATPTLEATPPGVLTPEGSATPSPTASPLPTPLEVPAAYLPLAIHRR